MKKMMVIFLVLVMVFVMVVGVVGAHEHDGPQHGGLGYWMNYDYSVPEGEDDWESACGRDAQTVKDLLRTPPRGCARWILAKHHMVAFLNLTEVHEIEAIPLLMGDIYYDEIIPRNELNALRDAFQLYILPALDPEEDKLNPYSPDYSREYSRCDRRHMLELKDILEPWNEGK